MGGLALSGARLGSLILLAIRSQNLRAFAGTNLNFAKGSFIFGAQAKKRTAALWARSAMKGDDCGVFI